MGKRAGRKRINKVTAVPLVAQTEEPELDASAFWKGVEIRERQIDGRLVSLVSRQTTIEAVLSSGVSREDEKRFARTAEELVKLWGLCRRYYLDAPPIEPQTGGFRPIREAKNSQRVGAIQREAQGKPQLIKAEEARRPAQDSIDEGSVANFGQHCHSRYRDAVKAVVGDPPTSEGRSRISALLSICVENKMPTELGKTRALEALKLLSRHWSV